MIRLFNEKNLSEAFNIVISNIKKNIDNTSDFQLQSRDVEAHAESLVRNFSVKALVINMDSRQVKVDMVNINANDFPYNYHVEPNKLYSCARITYSYDITGNEELLSLRPKSRTFPRVEGNVSKMKLEIPYQTFHGNKELSDNIKAEVKKFISPINEELPIIITFINAEVTEFNETLKPIILEYINDRMVNIQKLGIQNDDLNSL